MKMQLAAGAGKFDEVTGLPLDPPSAAASG
jgi:hypothetical protein